MNDEQAVAVRLASDSDREGNRQLRKRLLDAERGRGLRRTDDARGGQWHTFVDAVLFGDFADRADEAKQRLICGVVQFAERRARRYLGLCATGSGIVAADSEFPLVTGIPPAAGAKEIAP